VSVWALVVIGVALVGAYAVYKIRKRRNAVPASAEPAANDADVVPTESADA
jgi:hypothetical protein